ncbi:MAG TPA: deoxyribonuclease IV [Longimicrobiales bacterium]
MAKADYIFGSHTVDNGGIDMAVRRAANAGLSTLQLFTAIPKFYGDKSTIRPERVQRFRKALEETGFRPEHVIVHGAYVLSAATADPEKWTRAAAGLKKEMERSNTLGVGGVCFHPGSASDGDTSAAAERVARAMVQALEAHDGATRLLVENTAGAGRTLGRTAAEVADILSHIPPPLRARAGYGLDTCHLFASGYDIHTSRERFAAILDEFEAATGELPSFFHLNDSEGELGSNRDRHVLLGEGHIGVEPFRWLLEDRRSRGVPLILETPQLNYQVADDDPSGDPYDVKMAALLHSLSGRAAAGAS